MSILRLWRVFIALFALFAGCDATAANVLRIANFGEPKTLDPHRINTPWEARIAGDIFLGLTTEAADAAIIPGAAQKWVISEDGHVYTFTIRDHKWSNGEPVVAADFVTAFRRLLHPRTESIHATRFYNILNAQEFHLGNLDDPAALGVRALGERIVEFTLRRPTTLFLEQLSHHSAFPVPSHAMSKDAFEWFESVDVIGNGAYVVSEWDPSKLVKLKKNPQYYDRESVATESVIHYSNTNYDVMKQRFARGDIDIARDFPPSDLAWLRENLADTVHVNPTLGVNYFTINLRQEPLSNLLIRRALSMAVNREVITDKLLRGGQVPAYHLVPPGINNYPRPPNAPWHELTYEDRIVQAEAAMRELGYGPENPLKFVLLYNNIDGEIHGRVALSVAAMWKRIHVHAELVQRDTLEHYRLLQNGRFQIGRAGWIALYNDAENFLSLLESAATPFNYGGYKNNAFDNTMYTASLTTDALERGKLLARAERMIIEDQAVIPIYYYVSRNLVAKDISGWIDNTKDVHHTRYLKHND